MLRDYYFARWDQAYEVLAAGHPPMYVRLLALNALFLAIYAFRRVSGARPMPVASALFVQLAAVAASIVVLYQREVQNYLISLMDRL